MPTSRWRAWLALLVLQATVAACNLGRLFDDTGAPCATDANCPKSEFCCAGRCGEACSSGTRYVASVTVVSDYVPGYELDRITVDLDGESRTYNVNITTDLFAPQLVGQFPERTPERSYTVNVTLFDGETRVASRRVAFVAADDVVVPVVLTRDCTAVSCANDAQCEGARCVSPSCSALDPEACPTPSCTADIDCAPTSACAVGLCYQGVCMQRRNDGACHDDQRCIPGSGCVARDIQCAVENDCTDGLACTRDDCNVGRCISTKDDTLCALTRCDPSSAIADIVTGCTPEPCSADNCVPLPCQTATCVENRCTRASLCALGEQCCDGVCAANCSELHPCQGKPAGQVCRASAGPCDPAETCDGVSDACPGDVLADAGVLCRDVVGPCDLAESCTGGSAECPANVLVAPGVTCRPVADVCDVMEVCTGVSGACPVDGFLEGPVCRPAVGICDISEACNGAGAACPPDLFLSAASSCRGAANQCDAAEYCGAGPDCPPDMAQPNGTGCALSGYCDDAMTCQNGVCTGFKCPTGRVCCEPGLCAIKLSQCYL